MNKHNWERAFEKLKTYTKKLGFSIAMGKEDYCNLTQKIISLNQNRTLRNRVYILAHEIGHIKVRKSYGQLADFLLKFPGHACAKNTKGNKVSKLEEEVLAWVEARKILEAHNVLVDEGAFSRVKQICLGTYIS